MIPYLLIIVAFFALWYYMMNKAGGEAERPAWASSARPAPAWAARSRRRSPSRTSQAARRKRPSSRKVVNFLKNPKSYTDMGARIPKGVLLVGPPGTGKTLLAKAVAGEAGVQFLSISGSDFVELYVGVGASPCARFVRPGQEGRPGHHLHRRDRRRGTSARQRPRRRPRRARADAKPSLLVEMDGFTNNEGVIVMAATNRDDILDNALTRPGRFDRRVYIGLPDIRGREAILRVHAKGKPLADDVNLNSIARGTPGFSGRGSRKPAQRGGAHGRVQRQALHHLVRD